jgi:hypothetical protein
MGLALMGRDWPVNGSSFVLRIFSIATKPPKLSIRDENEWLEHNPVARFITNLPFYKRHIV